VQVERRVEAERKGQEEWTARNVALRREAEQKEKSAREAAEQRWLAARQKQRGLAAAQTRTAEECNRAGPNHLRVEG
jgi:hypothetical protein